MTYVVIVEVAGESHESIHKDLPKNFPVKVEEFDTSAAAIGKYPDKKIMTAEQYAIYADAMNVIFEHIKAQKPWWKFW